MANTQQSDKSWSSASTYLSGVDTSAFRNTSGKVGHAALLDSAHKKLKLKRFVWANENIVSCFATRLPLLHLLTLTLLL